MNGHRFALIWFAYRDDEALLLESLKAASMLFTQDEASFTVVEDGFCALSENVRSALADCNVAVRTTFYPRGGNLLGQANLEGQLAEMVEASRGADVLVKIDCDTVVMQRDWLDAFAASSKTMAGSYKTEPDYPMGNCYAVKASVLDALLNDVKTYRAWGQSYEDYEIGVRLHRLAGGDPGYAMRFRSGMTDGFWLCAPEEVTDDAKGARVVSCGFTWGTVPLGKRAEYKLNQIKLMGNLTRLMAERIAPEKEDGNGDGNGNQDD